MPGAIRKQQEKKLSGIGTREKRHLGEGEQDAHSKPIVVLERNRPLVQLHAGRDQGKAQAVPWTGTTALDAVKALKDLIQIRFRDPFTLV